METYRHLSPPDVEGYISKELHRIDIEENGEQIGFAELVYYGKPIPFYYLQNLQIHTSKRSEEKGKNKGMGRELDFIEAMVKEKGKACILENGINAGSKARGMYDRRKGWRKIPGTDEWYAFNLPKSFPIENLSDIQETLRGDKVSERKMRNARRKYPQ